MAKAVKKVKKISADNSRYAKKRMDYLEEDAGANNEDDGDEHVYEVEDAEEVPIRSKKTKSKKRVLVQENNDELDDSLDETETVDDGEELSQESDDADTEDLGDESVAPQPKVHARSRGLFQNVCIHELTVS